MRERDLKALEFDRVIQTISSFAVSEPGRERVAALHPAVDLDEVRHRLRTVSELIQLRGRSGSVPLDKFDDQRELMLASAPEGSVLGGEALVRIRDFVIIARTAEAFLRSRVETTPHLAVIVRDLLAPKELADALLRALADDVGLLDDASPELKRLRTRLRDHRQELELRLARSLNAPGMAPFVSDYVVTVRNGRFVLPLKINFAERLDGIVQDRSVSGETLFVEPMWAVELNNRLMLTEREVAAEEYRLLMQLSAMIRGYADELRLTFGAMVQLDALNATAIFAERLQGVEPEVTDEIQLLAVRHPLLVETGRPVVPIDLSIRAGQRGLVVSGPNTGGKTVALKTLGLLTLMAQAGIPIPAAEGAKLRLFRSIFADIGDEQSITANLSSFAAHVINVSEITRQLAEPAMIILDEPGAGTDPAGGSALAIGMMDFLAARDCLIAVATHSTAVKLHAYSRSDFDAAAVDFDAEHLMPLYRIKPHTIGQSYGIEVARRLGLPKEIVERALSTLPRGSAELAETLNRLEHERRELSEQTAAVIDRGRRLADREKQLSELAQQQRSNLEEERAALRDSVDQLIRETQLEGAKLLSEIKMEARNRRDLTRTVSAARNKLDAILPKASMSENAIAEPLRAGDQVELGGLRGELLAIEPGKAIFSRGGLRIEVAPERLHRISGPKIASVRAEPTVNLRESDGAELNLIGERTGEALRRLEEFLDQAYLSNQKEVRVVHGIGSGALRKAIHEYLANSRYCGDYRLAEPHQGGAGATVITMAD
jgi:DNA mismatch repair protein MutS2